MDDDRKANTPPASATSGATCGMVCMAPSTLVCMTASKSCCVGGVSALRRRMHARPHRSPGRAFSPSSCQARPLTLAGLATSTVSTSAPRACTRSAPGVVAHGGDDAAAVFGVLAHQLQPNAARCTDDEDRTSWQVFQSNRPLALIQKAPAAITQRSGYNPACRSAAIWLRVSAADHGLLGFRGLVVRADLRVDHLVHADGSAPSDPPALPACHKRERMNALRSSDR